MRSTIQPQSAISVEIKKDQLLRIIDTEGKQVADFVCFNSQVDFEFLSAKATIDTNGSIFLFENQRIFSSQYESLFTLVHSSVPHHDLIFPACSPAMFEKHYHISNHPNCATNLRQVLGKSFLPDPINFFMNTSINATGKIDVLEPLSKPGDYVELKAEKDLIVGIAACSVTQSGCNGFRCTGLEVTILP